MAAAWTTTSFSFVYGAGYGGPGINLDVPIDVNGDGLPDLIAASIAAYAGSSALPVPIAILLNQGNGHFNDATSTFFPGGAPTTIGPSQATVADFNGDGRPDLFISDTGVDGIYPAPGAQNHLFLSSGAHGFVDATNTLPQLSDFTGQATAADIDRNGSIDIFVPNNNNPGFGTGDSSSLRSYFLMNNGSGVSTQNYTRLPTAIEDPSNGGFSLLFDANGDHDHYPDLLLLGSDKSAVILLNDGTGDFSSVTPIDLPIPSGFSHTYLMAAAADLTGDGYQDLILEYERNYPFTGPLPPPDYVEFQVLVNDGHGNFTDETAQRLPNNGQLGATPSIQLVDINGDGFTDIVPRCNPSPILMNDGTGHFIALPDFFPVNYNWWSTYHPNFNPPNQPAFHKLAFDANHDGRMDILYEVYTGLGQIKENYVLFTAHYPGPTQNGTAGVDVLFGYNSNDAISGLGGKDIIFGGGGADRLYGGGVADYLNGGRGIDRISGGPGNDFLFGGPGADRFVFEAPLNALTNVDRILDFAHGLDKVVLSKTYFAGIATVGHPLAASQFHVGVQATTHFQHIIYNPINGFLYYDQDGNRAAHPQVHFATMTTGLALTHFDFLVAA